MTIKIHAFPLSPRGFKVLAVAEHVGADYEFVFCDLMKGATRRPEFAALNPNAKMPVLEDGAFKLWESNAIIQYLAERFPESGLVPKEPMARADVARWLFWESTTWDPAFAILVFENVAKGLLIGKGPDPAEVEKGNKAVIAAAAILDAHLAQTRFVTGAEVSLADFALGSSLIAADQAQAPLQKFTHIARWYDALSALPAWRATRARMAPTAA